MYLDSFVLLLLNSLCDLFVYVLQGPNVSVSRKLNLEKSEKIQKNREKLI